jgi:hypothetical protein
VLRESPRDADPHFRHAEFGIVGGNPEVAGRGDLEAAAKDP